MVHVVACIDSREGERRLGPTACMLELVVGGSFLDAYVLNLLRLIALQYILPGFELVRRERTQSLFVAHDLKSRKRTSLELNCGLCRCSYGGRCTCPWFYHPSMVARGKTERLTERGSAQKFLLASYFRA